VIQVRRDAHTIYIRTPRRLLGFIPFGVEETHYFLTTTDASYPLSRLGVPEKGIFVVDTRPFPGCITLIRQSDTTGYFSIYREEHADECANDIFLCVQTLARVFQTAKPIERIYLKKK
jgi:hypothetical protein